jgi:hypothetical protein
MARRRGARRLSHTSGAERPLDGVKDVGPAERPAERAKDAAPAPTSDATPSETLEDRQDRWFAERERYEQRRRAAPPP